MRFFGPLLLAVLISVACANAQDPSFSQIENTRLYTHSSDMAVQCGYEFEGAYRSQWNGIPGAFTTSFISGFYQSAKTKSGIGVKYMRDEEGSIGFVTEDIKAVYRFNFFKFSYYRARSLCFALEGGIVRKSVDWTKLIFSDQLDPVFGIVRNTTQINYNTDPVVIPDATLSATYKDKIKLNDIKRPFTVSGSWRHISVFDKDESILRLGERLPGIVTITASSTFAPVQYYNLPLFKPTVRFEYQRNIKRTVFGSLAGIVSNERKQTLYLGLFYSAQFNPLNPLNANGIIGMVGFEKLFRKTRYSFAYSYDLIGTGLGNATTTGSHEITLNIYIDRCTNEFDQPSHIFNPCPE